MSLTPLFSQEDLSREQILRALEGNELHDTSRVDYYNELAWPVYSYDQADSSIYYAEKAIELSKKLNDLKRLSVAHRRIGITYANISDIKSAIFHQEESYRISKEIGFKRGMLLALNNIGVAYLNNEVLNTALTYFLNSLKIAEETGDFSSAPSIYANCGMIYRRTGDLERSKDYFMKAKYYSDLQKNAEMQMISNSNLSTSYRLLKNLDSAAYYLEEAKKYYNENTSSSTRFNLFLTEALLLSSRNQHQKALESFLKMQPLATVMNDVVTLNINIAEEYTSLGQEEKALEYFQKAYDISFKNKMFNNLEFLSLAIANIYEKKNDLKKFSGMIRNHLAFRDSNARVNKVQQIQRQQLEYDYERRHLADSIKFQQKEQLKNLELEAAEGKLLKARSLRIALVAILIIVALVTMFFLYRFVVTKKQKEIIETQKQMVELKNEEILDSISYAKRLQSAILPQMRDVKVQLNADVLFLPKDIIGGDFYFFEEHRHRLYFAVCDCTGHGVPGALMSVVCYQALEKSIKQFRLDTPSDILTKAREIIIDNLNASDQNIQDGMDCSLLVINKRNGSITWAGANNGICIVHNGELREIKADKQPVAFYANPKPFTDHKLELEPGTTVYLYTDGYADQFGGSTAKKFKTKSLKSLLQQISNEHPEKQVALLQSHFTDWRGQHDQVDDVTVGILRF